MTDHRLEQTGPNDITPLLSALLDGELDADQRRALSERFESDQDVEAYLDWVIVNTFCRRQSGTLVPVGVGGSGFGVQDMPPSPMLRRSRSVGVLALAAALALAATAWFVFTPNPQPPTPNPSPATPSPVAMLSDISPDAVFADSSAPMAPGADLPAGPIRLTAGKAQIMFASTAVVDLTGPCEFVMTGPNRGRLAAGMIKAYVPEQARGFTIDLPQGVRVVDLGTAFRVRVDDPRRAALMVEEGRVQIDATHGVARTLEAGQSVTLADGRFVSDRWLAINDMRTVVAAQIEVGDANDVGGTVVRSTDHRITLSNTARGRYEPRLDSDGFSALHGVLVPSVRQNQQDDPAVDTPRYAVVEASRVSAFNSNIMGLSTQKADSVPRTPMSADTAIAWFAFADHWVGAHVDADGSVYAGHNITDSEIAVVEPAVGSPVYDVSIPETAPDRGMLFVVASSAGADLAQQVQCATAAPTARGWRVAVRDNRTGDRPEATIASEFSMLYVPYDTAGLIGGRVSADGQTFDHQRAGNWSIKRLAPGRYRLTLAGHKPAEGVLLLSVMDASRNIPVDNFMTYAISPDGAGYEIRAQDIDGSAPDASWQDTSFVFMFIPIDSPVQGPSTHALRQKDLVK
jgi:hypothetical protein